MDWSYDAWPSGEPYDWANAGRGHTVYDAMDYHVDLGCGKAKKGRIGIDRYPSPGVNIVMDLDTLRVYGIAEEIGADAGHMSYHGDGFKDSGLPFPDGSIESIISHHALEHIGRGFMELMREVYRVLKPGGIFRPITPLFPSRTALEDPTHKRLFMESTWEYLCGTPDNKWTSSFSHEYEGVYFELLNKDISPPTPFDRQWGQEDVREIRVALRVMK